MKEFFKTFILFISIAVIVFLALELRVRMVFPDHHDIVEKWNSYEEIASDCQTIIIGSSHGEKAIIPEMLKTKAFNLSYPSQDLYYGKKILEKSLAISPNVKNVIVVISWFSLGFDAYKYAQHLSYDYWNSLDIKPKDGINFSLLLRASKLYLYREKALSKIFKASQIRKKIILESYNDLGKISKPHLLFDGYRFVSNIVDEKQTEEISKKTYKRHMFENYQHQIEHKVIKDIKEIIALLNQKQINYKFIVTPTTSQYKKMFTLEQLDYFKNRLSGITFEDYSSLFNESDYFMDVDHLNYKGAKEFTEIISDSLHL